MGKNFHEGIEVIWVVEGDKNGGTKKEQGRRPDCYGEIWILSKKGF